MTAPATPFVPRTGYAPVNGLRMYYEIHGPDRENGAVPVLLLHGAYMTTGQTSGRCSPGWPPRAESRS